MHHTILLNLLILIVFTRGTIFYPEVCQDFHHVQVSFLKEHLQVKMRSCFY